jgi:hypothetical protein
MMCLSSRCPLQHDSDLSRCHVLATKQALEEDQKPLHPEAHGTNTFEHHCTSTSTTTTTTIEVC